MQDSARRVHEGLKSFYNNDPGYWAVEQAANAEITPERELMVGWINSGERVLDVGCGTCRNAVFLGGRAKYIGCDLSGRALQIAAETLPEGAASAFVQAESHILPFRDDSFDVVISTYALEHFVYPESSLAEMWRVCKPGGRVIVISPAYDDPRVLPPSTTHWSRPARGWLMATQAVRQLVRHVRPSHTFFAQVSRPRIFEDAFSSDFDAVHLVSAREVGNTFRRRGAEILFERRRAPRPGSGGGIARSLRETARNLLLQTGLGQYAGLNLQLVAGKPKKP
jgi:ubiquinone/menaquinone biosynthesis C-methylase UbiE